MSEPMYCPLSTMYCKGEGCELYHDATLQCKIVMAVNRFLGDVDAPKTQQPLTTYPPEDYSSLPWAEMRGGKGYWLWSDKSEGLAQKIHKAGGKLTEGGYDYGLYGDIHEELGIKKCVSRYSAREKT